MIFFLDQIDPFVAETGMKVTPIPITLLDNRSGFVLGDEWKDEIEAKGITVEIIDQSDLQPRSI